jgi:nitroreductase
MDFMEGILTRRSVRKFVPGPVTDEDVTAILRAATSAPSANDQRPWHFVVVDDRALLDQVPNFHPYSKMILDVPVAILVVAEPALEKSKGYWVHDCAAATQNLLLAAHARGLGGVWLGINPRPDREAGLRKLLGMPEDVIPFALVPIGHPAEQKGAVDRLDPARVHRNRW